MNRAGVQGDLRVSALIHQRMAPIERDGFQRHRRGYYLSTAKMQVSNAGGAQVRWRRDGNEWFYVALDGRLMAVTIVRGPGGALDSRTPVPLFPTSLRRSAHSPAVSLPFSVQ
jgi:hypothetical protein